MTPLEAVRADGLLARRPSGRGAAVRRARLDLPARSRGADRGPDAVRALHVNWGCALRAAADERHCEELCESLGVGLEVRAARGDRKRATSRRGPAAQRYGAAAELAVARGADVAAGHTATDQVETMLYRLASSPEPPGAARDAPPGRAAGAAAASFTREQTAAYCRARGSGGERTRRELDRVRPRARCASGLVPTLARGASRCRARTCSRSSRCSGRRARCSTRSSRRTLDGRDRGGSSRGLRALPPALARLVLPAAGRRRRRRPGPGNRPPAEDVMALRDDAALDLPQVRALVESKDGAVHATDACG